MPAAARLSEEKRRSPPDTTSPTIPTSSRQRSDHEKHVPSPRSGPVLASGSGGNGHVQIEIPRSPMTERLQPNTTSQPSIEPEPESQTLPKRSVAFNKDTTECNESGSSVVSTQGSIVGGEEDIHPASSASGTVTSSDDGEGDTGRGSSLETDIVDAQQQLNKYRGRLARVIVRRDMSSRPTQPARSGKSRVSPIQEETTVPSPQPSSEPTTTSTESGHTIRGGTTPGLTAGTPSYPFPRMVPRPFAAHQALHHPFTTLSPTTFPSEAQQSQPTGWEGLRLYDKVMSNPSTPASNMTFLPAGFVSSADKHDFPSPNLYELSLMLSAEPGLEAWWNTVVQIMTDAYKAERVTLAIPADSTDVENVPWGQKATYNVHWEDGLSMGYMARGSSLVPSSSATDDAVDTPSQIDGSLRASRPGIQSRHSFTAYEDRKERSTVIDRVSNPRRPNKLSRSVTSHPAASIKPGETLDLGTHPDLNRQALEEHDSMEEQQELPSWETSFGGPQQGRGKMLDVLQALDYEADPLIDHDGVMRVLERGKVIALTRSYPYLDQMGMENLKPFESKTPVPRQSPDGSRKKSRRARTGSTSKISSLLGGTKSMPSSSQTGKATLPDKRKTTSLSAKIEDDTPRPGTPKYEEYEQAPPSPWSQSPAPSPAVRHDTNENPFFTDAMVDEETFNPSSALPDYTSIRPPEAIGIDNSWTVLHIPLTHPLLSKPNPAFKLDSTLMEQKSSSRARAAWSDASSQLAPLSPEPVPREKHAPIAILSILSPIIPYPSNLRHSLDHLAPHLATSFSMCRHYTNLEVELNGLQKRRPQNAGFGAIGHDGRPLADPTALANMSYLPPEELSRESLGGSITSPSEYSAKSRSAAGSGGGTPVWERSSIGFSLESRPSASSPAPVGDSYFNTKPKPGSSGIVGQQSRRNSKEGGSADKRLSLRPSGGKSQFTEPGALSPDLLDATATNDMAGRSSDEMSATSVKSAKSPLRHREAQEPREQKVPAGQTAIPSTGKRSVPTTPGTHRHTQLHSYGADFASTFQSLPPSSTIGGKGTNQQEPPTRAGSISTVQTEMTPPSDRLKGLILDSLPAHVFVALPRTGEIVWVNSRFLTYRGKTSADLATDPWGSIHPDDRDDYLRAWAHCVRTGEQFSRTVRIRRFDGQYRWFYARAVASKDKRGVILQFLGSYMDIHDQHIAELRAARQEEIEASEAKHRLLANLIPQIIFTATEEEGITFANEQWLSYTGQSFEDSLGLGFMDHVHPEDLAKCRVPTDKPPTPHRDHPKGYKFATSTSKIDSSVSSQAPLNPDGNPRGVHVALSRNNSSSSSSLYELPTANLTELARKGVIKVATDSNGRLSYTTEIRLRSKFGDYRWHWSGWCWYSPFAPHSESYLAGS